MRLDVLLHRRGRGRVSYSCERQLGEVGAGRQDALERFFRVVTASEVVDSSAGHDVLRQLLQRSAAGQRARRTVSEEDRAGSKRAEELLQAALLRSVVRIVSSKAVS